MPELLLRGHGSWQSLLFETSLTWDEWLLLSVVAELTADTEGK